MVAFTTDATVVPTDAIDDAIVGPTVDEFEDIAVVELTIGTVVVDAKPVVIVPAFKVVAVEFATIELFKVPPVLVIIGITVVVIIDPFIDDIIGNVVVVTFDETKLKVVSKDVTVNGKTVVDAFIDDIVVESVPFVFNPDVPFLIDIAVVELTIGTVVVDAKPVVIVPAFKVVAVEFATIELFKVPPVLVIIGITVVVIIDPFIDDIIGNVVVVTFDETKLKVVNKDVTVNGKTVVDAFIDDIVVESVPFVFNPDVPFLIGELVTPIVVGLKVVKLIELAPTVVIVLETFTLSFENVPPKQLFVENVTLSIIANPP
uniref:Uncharacterized protein n=1 Tax=Panagrolaimus sp. JU765 TaxID=591449 RepID=A0AC34R477_9BILA